MVIANGTSSDYVIRQVLDGRKVGTFFTMVEETGPSVENQAAGGLWNISHLVAVQMAVKFSNVK